MLWFHLWWTLRLEANQNHKRILAFYSRVIFMTLRWLLQDFFPGVPLCHLCLQITREIWRTPGTITTTAPRLLSFSPNDVSPYFVAKATVQNTQNTRYASNLKENFEIISGQSFLSFFFAGRPYKNEELTFTCPGECFVQGYPQHWKI